MAAKTSIEKLKDFNEKQRQQNLANVPLDQRATPTNRQVVADKARVKTDKELEDEAVAKAEAERDRQADHLKQVTDATASLLDGVNNRVNPVKDWIAAQPTPGGVFALLLFIGFFALAFMPVDQQGHTRLYLMWQTILNRTHMLYRETTQVGHAEGFAGNPNVNGGSADFGGSNGNTPQVDLTHLNLFPGF